MTDSCVDTLLKKWGVAQLVDRCREQEVDFEALRSLKEDVISELVPHIGPRCKFIRGWKKWRDAGFPHPGVEGAPSPSPGTAPSPTSSAPPSPSASPAVPTNEPPEPTLPSHLSACSPSQPPVNQPPVNQSPVSQPPASQPGLSAAGAAQTEHNSYAAFEKSNRKEVSVYLEGRIVYENDDQSGWLSATGTLVPGDNRPPGQAAGAAGAAGASQASMWENQMIKAEPGEGSGTNPYEHPRRPKIRLEGRISLSAQDFMAVPSFMLQDNANTSCFEGADTPEAQMLGYQDNSMVPSISSFPMSSGLASRNSMPMAQDFLMDVRRMQAQTPTRMKRTRAEKLDLETLLNSSSKGKMILSLYRQRGCLDANARQTLTDLIIAEELREDFNRRITSQRFQEIAEAIVELFPGENEDTYFSNDRTYGDRPGGKGKLTSKYYNTRRQLAKSGVICRGHNKERRQMMQQGALVALQLTPSEEETAQQCLEWLQALEWPAATSVGVLALEKWRGCWKPRMQRVLAQGHLPATYLDDFPILLTPLGSSLINADFDMLLKTAGTRLLNDWPAFSQHVITILADDYRKQLPLLDHVRKELTTEEGRQVGALLLLTSMLPVTTCKGSGDSAELWRPTRQEAQDGFLLHVERETDWYAALENHRSRMRLMGQLISPLPIIVGKSLDDLEVAMVALENTTFCVPSALHAVDLCFKCFHALQVPYPPQAQNAWLFLQHAVYQVAVPTDRMSVAVSSLLADFGCRPVPPVMSWDQVLL